ncbi:site-specific integrase [Halobellus sp. Atlit-38R]|uniref:tyrosine-type recombinase/integrase n=1 Tax=Halobellus sp. Atlit-38R TaxID=2282131 RepID=UPI000EF1C159|nr:tyrosine-type recombinase/integrase [Halobellus sp. Atlit-38R]RLM83540.1 site-specific integrase [Halobellus sp. Atlit-38R]
MIKSFSRPAAADAPSKKEYQYLLAAAADHKARKRQIEDRALVHFTGRLGFRSGELIHFHEGWVDRDRQIIHIPRHDACNCRYCREQAAEAAAKRSDVTVDDVLDLYWNPKYKASARPIPYGYSEHSINIVETFLDEVGRFDYAQSTINRRVTTLQDRVGLNKVYPHALRAAAGFYWAEQGLEALYLQALMGWKDLRTATRYIQATGRQLDNRLRQLASGEPDPVREEEIATDPDDLPDPSDAVYNLFKDGRNPRASDETTYLHETTTDSDDNAPSAAEDAGLSPTTLDEFGGATGSA